MLKALSRAWLLTAVCIGASAPWAIAGARAEESGAQPQKTPAADAKADATTDAERRALRDKIRDGKFNTCIAEQLSNEGANYVLRLQNTCNLPVNVRLCLQIGDEPKAYYMLMFDAQTDSRTRFWTKQGEQFRYTYNSCNKPNCNPPASECSLASNMGR